MISAAQIKAYASQAYAAVASWWEPAPNAAPGTLNRVEMARARLSAVCVALSLYLSAYVNDIVEVVSVHWELNRSAVALAVGAIVLFVQQQRKLGDGA